MYILSYNSQIRNSIKRKKDPKILKLKKLKLIILSININKKIIKVIVTIITHLCKKMNLLFIKK